MIPSGSWDPVRNEKSGKRSLVVVVASDTMRRLALALLALAACDPEPATCREELADIEQSCEAEAEIYREDLDRFYACVEVNWEPGDCEEEGTRRDISEKALHACIGYEPPPDSVWEEPETSFERAAYTYLVCLTDESGKDCPPAVEACE